MKNCSFVNSRVTYSEFQNTSLSTTDFSYTLFENVKFINSDMSNTNLSYIQCNYCNFINVTLDGSVFKNVSLRYSNFIDCQLDITQLEEVIDFTESRLPKGIAVKSKN